MKKIGNICTIFYHNINGDSMEKSKIYYENLLKTTPSYLKMTKNFLVSFSIGGLICLTGELLFRLYYYVLNLNVDTAKLLMTLTFILTSGILTGLGLFDKIGQFAKCAVTVPITGFSNTVVSAALDYKNEGLVCGVATNALKLAGSVIVVGTTSGIFVAGIKYILGLIL